MLNSAKFFIFIAMAVSGIMKETPNARIESSPKKRMINKKNVVTTRASGKLIT